jgi:chromosome segregation ATPase
MSTKNDICEITRKSIHDKIDNLEEKVKLSIENINDRVDLQLQSYKNLISESARNTNAILDDQYNDINILSDKLNDLNIISSDMDHLTDKIKSLKNTISHLEKHIDLLNSLDKSMSSTLYDIEHIKTDIERIKTDIIDLENNISDLNSIFNSNDYKTIPKMVSMYDKIIKYKYIIIGCLLAVLFFVDGGVTSTIGTIIIKVLNFIGI